MDTLIQRLQYIVAAVLLIVIVAMLPGLVSAAASSHTQNTGGLGGDMTSSPNAVTRSFGYTFITVSKASNTMSAAVAEASGSTASAISHSGRNAVAAVAISGRFIANTAGSAIKGVGRAAYLTARMPVHLFDHAGHAVTSIDVLRPANNIPTPAIDPTSAVLAAATVSSASAPDTHLTVARSPTTIWPLHGTVTTLFGVPEPPYQPIHTGMDISDGEPAGVSPIHAFKAGVVIRVIHEHIRLGNEVVIEHGDGMTSVYGHLSSITARVGQVVTTSTILGYEGTTGVSTGPHLHFEIRINGAPVNPTRYIPGRP